MVTTGSNYENNLLDAIESIVDNAIDNANYDRTIQAKIISCIDPTIGKYRVQYQDSSFFAYSISTDYIYESGIMVYILIAGNDMSKDKTILGTVDKLGDNYVFTTEEDELYETVGNNCINSKQEFKLCSYGGNQELVVYDKEKNINLINLNINDVENYIKGSSYINCGASFKTTLPIEQQFRGNYGIIFEAVFIDNASQKNVIKSYDVGVNSILGNPYKLTKFTRQLNNFQINGNNFQYINKIYIYVNSFPNTKSDQPEDIFIKELELYGTIELDENNLNTIALTFITPQGTYFDDNDNDESTRSLQAQVKIKGKNIDSKSQNLQYYWFTENATITNISEKYCKYGGAGWACLNNFNIIQTNESMNPVVEWVPGSWEIKINKSICLAKETKFKCVVLVNNTQVEKEIVFTNYSSKYNISIESDSGTQFYYDIGNPNLTCLVNGKVENNDDYLYIWAEVDNNNNFKTLNETFIENNEYNTAKLAYERLLQDIKNEIVGAAASQEQLDQYLTVLKNYDKIMRVERNRVFSLAINKITNFSTYKCTVYYQGVLIGTASITIYNNLENADYYNLTLNNGVQVFNYTAAGIAPTNNSIENPLKLKKLSFNVFDCLGVLLPDEVIEYCNIKWLVPIENTLLKIPNIYTGTKDVDNNVVIYEDLLELEYEIADKYDINKTNNNISLIIDYKGIILRTETNFTFIKDGDPGTNGTEFNCQIIPNTAEVLTSYPMILNKKLNYTPRDTNEWFRVQLWHNGDNIFEGTTSGTSTEGKQVKVTWSNLLNKYSSNVSDNTDIKINENSFDYSGYVNDSMPANIIKCTVIYEGITYYATLPLITATTKDNYSVELKKDTGFRFATYSADGKKPQYDNSNPFELLVYKKINNIQEDISRLTKTEAINYNWMIKGKTYNSENKIWINKELLIDNSSSNLYKNQRSFKPIDDYDGECLNVGLECILDNNGIEVGRIHIPVHLLLNRYGNSAINDWDGNHIAIDEKGSGMILAPQIGAGQKENDNSFTGVVMGIVKESGKANAEVGLFGYNFGVRSFLLNAKDGSATFGKKGSGQLLIDPSQNKALIYSSDYWKNYDLYGKPTNYLTSNENGAGMLIDLTTPTIKFGSGNFIVTKEGYLTAKGGGNIAGWQIADTQLSKGRVGMSSDNSDNTNIAFWAGNTNKNNAPFRVNFNGELWSTSGHIGGWQINTSSLTGGNVTINSNGNIDCTGGQGWYIHSNGSAKFGNLSINTSGEITATGGNFNSVTVTGSITATSGTIGGCNIVNGSLQVGDTHITSLSADKLTAGTINGNVITVTNLSASNITGGILTSAHIHLNGGTVKLCTGGHVEFTHTVGNSSGFFTMGPTSSDSNAVATSHPYMSGINLAYGSTVGISFRSSTNITDTGSEKGYIRLAPDSVYDATYQLNIKGEDGIEMASSSGAFMYLWAKIELHAANGASVWASSDDVSAGRIVTTTGNASSRCLKDNITEFNNNDYKDAYELLKELNICHYDYKYQMYKDKHQYGFIIDDIEKLNNSNKFFKFNTIYAQIKDNKLYPSIMDDKSFNKNNLPEDCIKYKEYNADVLDKYLLTCLKALQNEVEELKEQLRKKEI